MRFLYRRMKNDPQAKFYIDKCKYCGKPYIKLQNASTLCSDDCRHKMNQDNKAKYQRKRRKMIKDGVLISSENDYIGTSFLSAHAHENFKIEHKRILKERNRIGV